MKLETCDASVVVRHPRLCGRLGPKLFVEFGRPGDHHD